MVGGLKLSRRATTAAFLVPLAWLLVVAAVPIQFTEASFTDAEVVTATLTAGTLGTAQNLTCATSGRSPSLQLSWGLAAGTAAPNGYEVSFRNGTNVVIRYVSASPANFDASAPGFTGGTNYDVTIKARYAVSGGEWLSKTPSTPVTVSKLSPRGWRCT
jgi:predicted ribosomally synthesized peptide with SipW-like signal peptide